MTQAPMPALPQARRPGPGLGLSLTVMGVGFVIVIGAVITIVLPFVGSFTSPEYQVPAQISLHLRHAEYTVYQRTGTRSGLGSSSFNPVRILPGALTITGSDGTPVQVSLIENDVTITRGSAIYTGSLVFKPPSRGTYRLNFTNQEPSTVVVARSFTDAIKAVFVWFGIGALGGFLMLAGLVMWIVGSTRHGRAKRALYGYGPPPQWGPPQQQWGPPPQHQWGPPPQQQWGPPPQQQQQWGPPPQQQTPPPQAPAQQQWPPPPDPPAN